MKNLKGNESDQIAQYVMSVTDQRFSNLSAEVLAYSFKIERTKLSRLFKHQKSITLKEFIFRERMSRAVFLLRIHLSMTVREISERVGFSTCDYFSRRFKEHYGVTPGVYRKLKVWRLKGKLHHYVVGQKPQQ